MAFACGLGSAHETDNFRLSQDTDLADLDDFLDALHTLAIEEAVDEMNARVESALATGNQAARTRLLNQAHNPYELGAAVVRRFGSRLTEKGQLEGALRGSWAQQAFPGKSADHANSNLNVAGRIPLDPRMLIMLTQSRTIKAYGVYFGTDKLLHFHQVGWDYYQRHRALSRRGLSREEVHRRMIRHFADTGIMAERNFFGTLTTGVYSNADMAANLLGLKFYQNLTEPVVLKGRKHEPLVVRSGVFWRVNRQVRPQSGWFGAFVSDHWNEALNPSLFDPTMRPGIRRILRKHAASIIGFYTVKDRRPNNAAYFDQLARKLSTYHGESYGHSGNFENLIHIGNTCYPALGDR